MQNNFYFIGNFSNIYKNPSRRSEVTSQIIYGEKFKILSRNKNWLKIKTMFFAGGLMALTNLLFAVLAWTGKSEILFAIAVIADDITAAFATVAFVAFISLLVDRTYTATQYALLASIGTAGRTTLASSSGALVDWLNGDWGTFFVLTTIMVIPSLICLWLIKNNIKIGAK